MPKTILFLGHTGKMGSALHKALSLDYTVIGRNSGDFDAADFNSTTALVDEHRPELIINTVAFMGLDQCEQQPEKAQHLNTLFPHHLARISAERGITLLHFSTDAVFSGEKQDYYTEEDTPSPLNMYGVTKYGGECLVRSNCDRHYIVRVPLLFGQCDRKNQFVEKMLGLAAAGQNTIRVSADLVSSPSYSCDIAAQIRLLLAHEAPCGTYHLANEGRASLYELMTEIAATLDNGMTVEKASYRDFPFIGRKNSCTPLRSVKTASLRPWREAVQDYCRVLREGEKHG